MNFKQISETKFTKNCHSRLIIITNKYNVNKV